MYLKSLVKRHGHVVNATHTVVCICMYVCIYIYIYSKLGGRHVFFEVCPSWETMAYLCVYLHPLNKVNLPGMVPTICYTLLHTV